jgi:hypothetical protein
MITAKQIYRALPYPVKCLWMNFRGGFSSFNYAIRYRFEYYEWWDFEGDFWEEINSGWMRHYIYPYDDIYNPTISKARQLRLDQHPPDLSLKR